MSDATNDSTNETQLTAYALGELSGEELTAFEARLADDESLRREVEAIRGLAGQLQTELATELATEPQRATIAAAGKPIGNAKGMTTELPPTLKMPTRSSWAVTAGVAASVLIVGGATIAVMLPTLGTARRAVSLRGTERARSLPTSAGNASVAQETAAGVGAGDRTFSEAHADAGKKPNPSATVAAAQPTAPAAAERKIPYEDILRYPTDGPDVSRARTDQKSAAESPPAVMAVAPVEAEVAAPAVAHSVAKSSVVSDAAAPTSLGTVATAAPSDVDAAVQSPAPTASFAPVASAAPAMQAARGRDLTWKAGAGALAMRGSNSTGANLGRPLVTEEKLQRGDADGFYFKQQQQEDASGNTTFGGQRHEREGNTEAYDRIVDNPFMTVAQNPLSTFSIDVDTASYSNMRRFLLQGVLPPKDSVRIEELVNYFPYEYDAPKKSDDKPFAANVEVAACPWRPEHRLVRVGLKGKEIAADKRPASNLVFLIDVSGSMQPENKLPLVKRAMRMLADQLNGEDRVAIAVYAGHSGLVLPSTTCNDADKQSILNALENLDAGGSTNGGQGIQLAYDVAQSNFIKGGTNRVILCTDGDFNVGVTNQGDLTRLIEEKAKGGVFLSVLGFGMGNLKDSTMEKLADKGNGNYAYIDTQSEAKKVLVEQMAGTLVTIAKDVKIQIEFNPAVVGSYRLIGYENRLLAKEDFNNDKKDAGEIGAGHAVTALYEVELAGATATSTPAVDDLKYRQPLKSSDGPAHGHGGSTELLTLKLRYKQPDGDKSTLMEVPVSDSDTAFAKSSGDFKFASAVAALGMILRDSPNKGTSTYAAVREWAEDGLGKDASGYRHEFLDLVKRAEGIDNARR